MSQFEVGQSQIGFELLLPSLSGLRVNRSRDDARHHAIEITNGLSTDLIVGTEWIGTNDEIAQDTNAACDG
jgi:hypothetical protein